MTVSELMAEIEARPDPKGAYAGGMTEGDIEEIKEASAALRAKRAKARGT